jgi:hypothetical protein
VLKINSGIHNYKNVDTIDKVMLKYSSIKFTDVPLFVWYLVICIEASSIEAFYPKGSSPCAVY